MPRLVATLAAVLALHGCGTAPRTGPAAAPELAAPQAPSLAIERHWLQSWFKGTPVTIVQRSDGSVGVEVPREYCFDGGRSNVKPALGAVLDKVAESLRRTPLARLELVAAPGDSAAASPLALQRANQVRRHLLSRGVPAAQIGAPTATGAAAVQLRMALTAPPP